MDGTRYFCPVCRSEVTATDARAQGMRCTADHAFLIAARVRAGSTVPKQPAEWGDRDEPSPGAPPPSTNNPARTAPATHRDGMGEPASANDDGSPTESQTTHGAGADSGAVRVYQVLPPPLNAKDAASMEQLVGTLSALPGPVAFEIAGTAEERKLMVRGAPAALQRVAAQLYEVYGQVELIPLDAASDPANVLVERCAARQAMSVLPARAEFLAIKTWREFEAQEPLLPLLAAFGGLAPGEAALSQVIVHGAAPRDWARPHLEYLAALQRRGYGAEAPISPRSGVLVVGAAICLLISFGLVLWAFAGGGSRWWLAAPMMIGLGALMVIALRQARSPWRSVLSDDAAQKLRDGALQVEIRLFAGAATTERAGQIISTLNAAYGLFNTGSGNHLSSVALPAETDPDDLRPAARTRPALLNVREIAGLWHMPVLEALELVRRQTVEHFLPRPAEVTHPNGRIIGTSRKGQQRIEVALSPQALERNLLVIGKTQHGKSTLMENVIAGWMKDSSRAVVVIDPHGDMARRLIGLVPAARVADVIYVDLADESVSAGLNLLDTSDGSSPDRLVQAVADIGKALWDEYWGWRMRVPVSHSLRALAVANQRRPPDRQYTLFAIPTLLTCNQKVRADFLMREVPADLCPKTRRYFQTEYEALQGHFLQEVISPVLSKIDAFEQDPALWRLLGQPRSTIRLYEALRSRKILIVNTNAGVIGDELAGFIGSFFLNAARRAIMAQATLPRAERVRVAVAADEFHSMKGVDHGRLAGDLIKFGGNFIFGTQALAHLAAMSEDASRLEGLLAGVSTLVVLQTNGEDAEYLAAKELDTGRLRPESLLNLPPGHAYIKTVNERGERIPVFSVELAPPLVPDAAIERAVLARRSAYVVPAAEADRLYRLSLAMLDEYGVANSDASRTPVGAAVSDAAAMMEQVRAAPETAADVSGHDPDGLHAGAQPPAQEAPSPAPEPVRPKDDPLVGVIAGAPAAPPTEAGWTLVGRKPTVIGPAAGRRLAALAQPSPESKT